jgi:YesN/AraC family two-component response regulator
MFYEYNPSDDDELIATEEGDEQDEFSEDEAESEQFEGDDSIGESDEQEEGEQESESDEEEDLIDTWAKQRENYQQTAADSTANRVVETVSTSPLMQEILKYKSMGYTDDQIALGIAKLHAQQYQQQGQQQQQQQQQEQYTEEGQQPDIRTLIQQEIQRAMSPMQNQMAHQQSQQKLAQNVNHNKSMFESAFKKFGVTDVNNENTIKAIGTAVNALYPGISLKEQALTKEQAEAVIALSMKKIGTKKKASGSKSATAPNILGGQSSSGKAPSVQSKSKMDGTSKQERKQNINKLFI